MPGKNRRFTEKQDRMAKHIAASERGRGVSDEQAERIGYATVNKRKQKSKLRKPSVPRSK